MQDTKTRVTLECDSSRKESEIEFGLINISSLGHEVIYEDVEVDSSMDRKELLLKKEDIKLYEKNVVDLENDLSFEAVKVESFETSEISVLNNHLSSVKDKGFFNTRQENGVAISMADDVRISKIEPFKENVEVNLKSEVSQEVLRHRTEETVKRFICNQCNKSFTRFCNLRIHMENHQAELKFKCDVCKKKFSSSELLNIHLPVHLVANSESKSCNQEPLTSIKAQKDFCCKICNTTFIHYYDFDVHIKSHENIAEFFSCHVCLKSNLEKQENETNSQCKCKYKCETCKIGFVHEYALYVHSHITHKVKLDSETQDMHIGCVLLPKTMKLLVPKTKKMPSCELCGVTFKRNKDLNVHLFVHTNKKVEKKHECSVCNKRFMTKSTLKYHIRIHTGEKPWPCEICDFSFSHKSSLKRHMRTHTGEKPYECKICPKKFSSNNILRDHLRVHTREKPFICDVCKKAFWRKAALNEHYIIHTGERPHECDVCGKVFKYPFKLKIHYKTHTQDRQFECETCKKKFLTKHQYKEHTYTHTGEKPYLCTFAGCGKAFSRSAILGRHILIHTGRQPYVCEICKKGFNQKTSLTRHYVVHTQEKPYSCEFCEQSFSQKAYLQFHKRQKHDGYMT